ncbi:MAG: hypothetical protein AAFR26_08855 [Cyanobacteria bacterium J06626_4]
MSIHAVSNLWRYRSDDYSGQTTHCNRLWMIFIQNLQERKLMTGLVRKASDTCDRLITNQRGGF